MKNEAQFSNLIYEFFLMRFRFQYYSCGDTLPSIDTLCREFCVSAQTVKAALRFLREDGYIDMHNGRPTKVLFCQETGEQRAAIEQYFSERAYALTDLCRTASAISIPLLAEGFRRVTDEDLNGLSRLAERAGSDDILLFFSFVLQKLDNSLVMNLYWEITLFMGLLFLGENAPPDMYRRNVQRDAMKEFIACRRDKNWDRLKDGLARYNEDSAVQALAYVQKYISPAGKQISFVWRIYFGRPQLCYSLALRLLHEIYLGEYRNAAYLPSQENIARSYHVSLSTVRRSLDVLNKFGVTKSVNGVGTRILSPEDPAIAPDFESPAVRRNLSYYFQSFELLIYSCKEAFRDTAGALAQEEKDALIKQLEENRLSGRCAFSLWHLLIWIATHHPLKGVREIYSKLYGLFLWGYPLKQSQKNTPALDQTVSAFTDEMITYLKKDDIERCSDLLKEQIIELFPAAQRYLLKHGIKPEELRLALSIRLLLT